MKKWAVLCVCLLFVLGTSACSMPDDFAPDSQSEAEIAKPIDTTTPTGTLTLLMESIKVLEPDDMKKYVTDQGEDDDIIGDGFGDLSDDEALGLEIAKKYTKNISYTITGETIEGDSAIVDVSITAPDLEKALTDIMGDVAKEAALAALTGRTVNMEEYILAYIRDKVNFDRLSSTTSQADVRLVRQSDGTWLVSNSSSDNYDFANALTGGIMDKMSEYADMFGF